MENWKFPIIIRHSKSMREHSSGYPRRQGAASQQSVVLSCVYQMDGSGTWYTVGRTSSNSPARQESASAAAAACPRACDGSGAAASRDPRATGACRCPPWWGCGCTSCRSRPSASKNKKGPAAGGGWGGRLPPARLGGCPTAPRSKQHARGAADVAPTRGAAPFAPHADPRPRREPARARPSVHAPSCELPRAPRAGSGCFPWTTSSASAGASPSSSAAVFLGYDLTGRAWSGAPGRTAVRVVVALKSSGSSVAFAGDHPDQPFLILSESG
jgi:hypothetical protein